MLNKNRSQQFKAWKFSLVIPFLAFFLVAFNTKTVTRVKPSTARTNMDAAITKIAYTIDKASTDADLKNISATLKNDYKVDMLFKDISRNSNGYITAINALFGDFDSSVSFSPPYNAEGIKHFLLFLEFDQEGRLIAMGDTISSQENPTKSELNEIQESDFSKILEVKSSPYGDPLFIVDGVEYKGANAPDLDPSEIQSINVLKKTEAIKKYGDKGKNGVVEITTKKNSGPDGPNENLQLKVGNNRDSITKQKDPSMITITGYRVSEITDGTDPNAQEKAPKTITVTGYRTLGPDPNPLIIVDGVEKEPDFNMSTLAPDTIENVQIFKNAAATQQYGKKGANGVVDITTKKSGWVVGYGINTDDQNGPFNLAPFKQNGMEKAVIFVDGKNKGTNYVPTMKYSEVESIGTYPPGESTTDKFGRQGKNGVIEITTKKN